MYRLYPMPPLYEPIAEHMRHYEPRDYSRPDTHYVYPPRPQRTGDDGDEVKPEAEQNQIESVKVHRNFYIDVKHNTAVL